MITKERAIEYLATHGMVLPGGVVDDLLVLIGTADECLTANYPPEVVSLVELYLLALFGFAQFSKYVSSESAPNGASRSYRFASLPDTWRGIVGMLNALDPKGCTTALIPPAPFQAKHAGLWVAVAGGGMCGGSR